MTRWVGVDVLTGQPPRAQRQHLRRGGPDVLDHDVEVELLRPLRVRPPRRLVVWRQLKGDSRGGVVLGDHYPVLTAVRDAQAKQLGVESSQRRRVGTVDDHVMKTSDHGAHHDVIKQTAARVTESVREDVDVDRVVRHPRGREKRTVSCRNPPRIRRIVVQFVPRPHGPSGGG